MTEPIPTEPASAPESNVSTEKQPAIRQGWLRALLILPAWLVFAIVAGLVMVFGLGMTDTEGLDKSMGQPIGVLIQFLQMLAFLIPIVIYRKYLDNRSIKSLGFELNKTYALHLLWGALSGIGLISVIFLVLYFGGGLTVLSVQAPSQSFLILTIVMILVGIGEESAVRGYLLANCMDSWNKYVALFVTSLFFAGMHLMNPNASALGTINIVLAGILLGVYYVHRRNLWFPIALHWTWNLFQGSVYGSEVSGVEIESILTIETTGSEVFTGGKFGFEASAVATVVLCVAIVAFHFIFRPPTTDQAPAA